MGRADEWRFVPSGVESGFEYHDAAQGVRVFDLRGRWSDGFGDSGPVEKIGYTVHHAVTGVGDGSLWSDVDIIDAIHRFHTQERGWGGIGYHRVIGAGKRVYLVGESRSQRAHVLGLNHQWIGYCFLGDWTHARPDEDRMTALKVALSWETRRRNVPMLIAPHKKLQPGTECPGGWASAEAWSSLVLHPGDPEPVPVVGPDDFQRGRREVIDAADREVQDFARRFGELDSTWGIP